MKKKSLLAMVLIPLALLLTFIMTSCNSIKNIKEIKMKDSSVVEITAGDFSYEGKKVVLVYKDGSEEEIDLREEMIPDVEKLKFFKMGEHDVTVMYSTRLNTIMKIKVVRREFDSIYELQGYTCTYDGKPHSVSLNYELPEGATIDYVYGNSFTNAGEYDVVGVISKNGYNSKTLTTKLKIEKVDYDNEIEFNDLTTTYDGEAKSIQATGLPNGVTVTYDIYNSDGRIVNNAVNVGTYKVVAKFSNNDDNHKKIDNMEATLTINKAKYDMSRVKFDDATVTYNGSVYVPQLAQGSVLPNGVTLDKIMCIDSEGNETLNPVNAGEYKMVASFKGNKANYEEIPSMEAKLTIEKRTISIKDKISLPDETINYDREHHSLELEGDLPDTVEVTFKNNDQIRAGEYKVTATFVAKSANEKVDLDELVAYLIINKIDENIKVIDEVSGEPRDLDINNDIVFDKSQASQFKITGFDTEKYKIQNSYIFDLDGNSVVVYQNNQQYRYRIVVTFVNEDDAKSVILSPLTGIFTYTS